MKIEAKISGWSISDYEIQMFPPEHDNIVTLLDIDKLSKRSAQWIFDNYNLVGLKREVVGCHFGVIMSDDDICKVCIMEYHPDLEKILSDYFDEAFGDWRKCYLRFGH